MSKLLYVRNTHTSEAVHSEKIRILLLQRLLVLIGPLFLGTLLLKRMYVPSKFWYIRNTPTLEVVRSEYQSVSPFEELFLSKPLSEMTLGKRLFESEMTLGNVFFLMKICILCVPSFPSTIIAYHSFHPPWPKNRS
jgi:hypothetical protein